MVVTSTDSIQAGDKVMTADGKELGTVKEVEGDRFKVERRFFKDYWLAKEFVDHVSGGIVQLILTKEAIGAAKV